MTDVKMRMRDHGTTVPTIRETPAVIDGPMRFPPP